MNSKNIRNVIRLNRKPGFPEFGDSILASLSRAFVSRSPHVYMRLFTALVRPLLELFLGLEPFPSLSVYIGGWRPSSGELLGVFQACVHFRIRDSNLDSLELRRRFADLILLYKLIHHSPQCHSLFTFFFIEDPRSLFQNIASSC